MEGQPSPSYDFLSGHPPLKNEVLLFGIPILSNPQPPLKREGVFYEMILSL